jgi:uncharacterized protein YodC (DUF2158 family)
MELKPGMIVRIKSGGPSMTVKFHNQQHSWTCTWFDGAEVKEYGFSAEQLEESVGTLNVIDYSKWSVEDLEVLEKLVDKN